MKLTGLERILLTESGILPTEGNRMLLGLVMDLQKQLSFSAGELVTIGHEPVKDANGVDTGNFRFSSVAAAALEKDIAIPEHLEKTIRVKLQALDKDNKLTPRLIPLFDRWFQGEDAVSPEGAIVKENPL